MKALLLIWIAILTLFNCHSAFSEWKNIYTGFCENSINSIVIDGDYIYAGTSFDIYISSNNGESWRCLNKCKFTIESMESMGSIIFAVSNTIFKSIDSGKTWINIGSGIPFVEGEKNRNVIKVQVFDEYLYASTESGIFKSKDYGLSWDSVGLIGYCISSIAKKGDSIFAISDSVYFSSNNGKTWIQRNIDTTNFNIKYLNYNCINFIGNNVFAATNSGLHISTDLGLNWSLLNKEIKNISIVNSHIYGFSDNHLFSSTDSGKTWEVKDSGKNFIYIKSIAISDNNIFVGEGAFPGTIYHSFDYGKTFKRVSCSIEFTQKYSLAVKDENIYVIANNDLLFSTDAGNTWGLSDDIAASDNPNSILVNDNKVFVCKRDSSIYISNNQGKNWLIRTFSDKKVNSLTRIENNIYAGTEFGGLFISTDFGETWNELGLKNKSIIAIDGKDDFILVTAKDEGIYRGVDKDFILVYSLKSNTNYSSYSFIDNYIVVGFDRHKIISSDNGFTWDSVNSAFGMVSSKVYHNIIFASDLDRLFFSSDYGTTWIRINAIPKNLFHNVQSFYIYNDKLYVATAGGYTGIYVDTIPNILATAAVPEESMQSGKMKIFPNPAHSIIALDLANPLYRAVDYRIIDAMGRTVSTGIFPITASNESCNVDISGLAPGIYHIILSVGKDLQTGSFVKLRD